MSWGLGSPPRDFPRSWTYSSRELTVRGSVNAPVGEIPWFLCASAEKLHAQGPLPVKEIAIYFMTDGREGVRSVLSKIRIGILLLSPSTPIGVAASEKYSIPAKIASGKISGRETRSQPLEERALTIATYKYKTLQKEFKEFKY
jgi:hypothetical protein